MYSMSLKVAPAEPPEPDQDEGQNAATASFTCEHLGVIPPPTITYPRDPCRIYCYRNGIEVDGESFRWDPLGGPIYTDGSAMHAIYPSAATAGSAAIQCTSTGEMWHILYTLDTTMPRTAVATEHVALIIATLLADEPSHIVSDCQAVVLLWGKTLEQRVTYKAKITGFAAQADFTKISGITKVKSHRTKQPSIDLGQEVHHRGNELADAMAERARPTYEPKETEDYHKKQKARHSLVSRAVNRLVVAKNRVKLVEKPKPDGARRGGPARPRKRKTPVTHRV